MFRYEYTQKNHPVKQVYGIIMEKWSPEECMRHKIQAVINQFVSTRLMKYILVNLPVRHKYETQLSNEKNYSGYHGRTPKVSLLYSSSFVMQFRVRSRWYKLNIYSLLSSFIAVSSEQLFSFKHKPQQIPQN